MPSLLRPPARRARVIRARTSTAPPLNCVGDNKRDGAIWRAEPPGNRKRSTDRKVCGCGEPGVNAPHTNKGRPISTRRKMATLLDAIEMGRARSPIRSPPASPIRKPTRRRGRRHGDGATNRADTRYSGVDLVDQLEGDHPNDTAEPRSNALRLAWSRFGPMRLPAIRVTTVTTGGHRPMK